MPFPELEVVVQYWQYSLVDDWRSTPRGVTLPGGRRVPLPVIRQHHEGDWEAVTVGLSADTPLFVDWSAHCAGEWRPFAGATPRRRRERRAHSSRLLDRPRVARQPAAAR